jgi:hypothetical protein
MPRSKREGKKEIINIPLTTSTDDDGTNWAVFGYGGANFRLVFTLQDNGRVLIDKEKSLGLKKMYKVGLGFSDICVSIKRALKHARLTNPQPILFPLFENDEQCRPIKRSLKHARLIDTCFNDRLINPQPIMHRHDSNQIIFSLFENDEQMRPIILDILEIDSSQEDQFILVLNLYFNTSKDSDEAKRKYPVEFAKFSLAASRYLAYGRFTPSFVFNIFSNVDFDTLFNSRLFVIEDEFKFKIVPIKFELMESVFERFEFMKYPSLVDSNSSICWNPLEIDIWAYLCM